MTPLLDFLRRLAAFLVIAVGVAFMITVDWCASLVGT